MYGVIRWGEREWFTSCGERQIRRGKSSGEQVDVGSLIVIQAHDNVSFWAAAGTHIWVLLRSVLMSLAPETTSGLEDRAALLAPSPH